MNSLCSALIVLTVVTIVPSSPPPGSEGGVETGDTNLFGEGRKVESCKNKTYIFYKSSVNWAMAQMACEYNNKSFSTILSQSEQNQFVADRTQQGLNMTGQLWVDGYDAPNNTNFTWGPQQIPFHYQNWAPGYPKPGKDYRCVYLAEDSNWINDVCRAERFYACQQCSQ